MLHVFNQLRDLAGISAEPVHGASLPGEVRRVAIDISKANDQLGWTPKVQLDDGMKSVIDWLQLGGRHYL